ncbi:hypothetical protein CVT24_004789 [Panaeolus cyanescens]|uniref:Uncharacterized protein n=1 Tax=Panaeolus cyanescens TaxID=181874 RepID=A0A409WYM4_9AGAR|nr:hypothetical protein CVT24_004789 [Panaeolus cyanescens]
MPQTLSSKAKGKQREVALTLGPDATNKEVTQDPDAQNTSVKYACDHCGKRVGYKTYLAHRKLPKVRMPTHYESLNRTSSYRVFCMAFLKRF